MLTDVPHNKGTLVFGNGLGGGIQRAARGDKCVALQTTAACIAAAGVACRCNLGGGSGAALPPVALAQISPCPLAAPAGTRASLTRGTRTAWGSTPPPRARCTAESGPPASATGAQQPCGAAGARPACACSHGRCCCCAGAAGIVPAQCASGWWGAPSAARRPLPAIHTRRAPPPTRALQVRCGVRHLALHQARGGRDGPRRGAHSRHSRGWRWRRRRSCGRAG